MGSFSLIHWLILGVVILLLFGGNRFSAMMGDVAKGLKSFKQGMSEDDQPAQRPGEPRALGNDRPIDLTPSSTSANSSTPASSTPDDTRR